MSTQPNSLNLFKHDLVKDKAVNEKFNALYTEKQGDWHAISDALTEAEGFMPSIKTSN